MDSVAIGAFYEKIVCIFWILGRGIEVNLSVAKIATENHPFIQATIFIVDFQKGRADNMASILVSNGDIFVETDLLAVLDHSSRQFQGGFYIVFVIEWLFYILLFSPSLSFSEECFIIFLHQMSSIEKDYLHQIECCCRRYDFSPKSLFVEQRDTTHMVKVTMGDQQIVDLFWIETKFFIIFVFIQSLEHTAIY